VDAQDPQTSALAVAGVVADLKTNR
jgi:hypothetical protein